MTIPKPEQEAQNQYYRVLDAAKNRAGEGLRVVEDFTRMMLGDRHLTLRLKQLRHQLTGVISELDPHCLIAARDTAGDIGTEIGLPSEYRRESTSGLVQANLSRVQQALRTIEEYSKSINPRIAQIVEQLRYQSYTLEKAILTTVLSTNILKSAQLYVIVDGGPTDVEFGQQIRQLVAAQVDLIQLRDKSLSDRELLSRAAVLSSELSGSSTRWIMNDRADLASAGRADGVHLGQDDISVGDARRILGPAKLIGVSTHSIDQARQAVVDGANYIGVGPVFSSRTKTFDVHVGLALVAEVASEISLPAFAIGGIDENNIASIRDAGMNRVAIASAITKSADRTIAISSIREQLRSHCPS